ncbi:hypothetical protein BVY03_04355 [bacterium K02(2017)]|nr:hypothetical protein BVY03_04355 [bacterium K02(2017)]
MPTESPQNHEIDLAALLKHLNQSKIEFVVVGGLAAVIQGAPITAFDLDIVHLQTNENIQKLASLLESLNAYQRCPDNKIIKPTSEHLSAKGHLLLNTNYGPLDILAVIEQNKGYKDLLNDVVEIEIQDMKIKVLSLEAIVKLKKFSKDNRDKQRLPVLEETINQKNNKTE